MFSSKIAAIAVAQTTLVRGRFRFLDAIRPTVTTLSPNSPIRGGCRVSLQALVCLQTQQVFSPGQAARIHSNPQSSRSPHPTHIWSCASCPFFSEGVGVHRINVKSELSPCFLQSLLLIFLLFSSANLFKLLSPFLLSPSLISKPLSLRAAGAQLCVCDCMCVHTCVCVCGCVGFFWHGAATPNIAHCTQRTGAAEKRGKKERGENREGNIWQDRWTRAGGRGAARRLTSTGSAGTLL